MSVLSSARARIVAAAIGACSSELGQNSVLAQDKPPAVPKKEPLDPYTQKLVRMDEVVKSMQAGTLDTHRVTVTTWLFSSEDCKAFLRILGTALLYPEEPAALMNDPKFEATKKALTFVASCGGKDVLKDHESLSSLPHSDQLAFCIGLHLETVAKVKGALPQEVEELRTALDGPYRITPAAHAILGAEFKNYEQDPVATVRRILEAFPELSVEVRATLLSDLQKSGSKKNAETLNGEMKRIAEDPKTFTGKASEHDSIFLRALAREEAASFLQRFTVEQAALLPQEVLSALRTGSFSEACKGQLAKAYALHDRMGAGQRAEFVTLYNNGDRGFAPLVVRQLGHIYASQSEAVFSAALYAPAEARKIARELSQGKQIKSLTWEQERDGGTSPQQRAKNLDFKLKDEEKLRPSVAKYLVVLADIGDHLKPLLAGKLTLSGEVEKVLAKVDLSARFIMAEALLRHDPSPATAATLLKCHAQFGGSLDSQRFLGKLALKTGESLLANPHYLEGYPKKIELLEIVEIDNILKQGADKVVAALAGRSDEFCSRLTVAALRRVIEDNKADATKSDAVAQAILKARLPSLSADPARYEILALYASASPEKFLDHVHQFKDMPGIWEFVPKAFETIYSSDPKAALEKLLVNQRKGLVSEVIGTDIAACFYLSSVGSFSGQFLDQRAIPPAHLLELLPEGQREKVRERAWALFPGLVGIELAEVLKHPGADSFLEPLVYRNPQMLIAKASELRQKEGLIKRAIDSYTVMESQDDQLKQTLSKLPKGLAEYAEGKRLQLGGIRVELRLHMRVPDTNARPFGYYSDPALSLYPKVREHRSSSTFGPAPGVSDAVESEVLAARLLWDKGVRNPNDITYATVEAASTEMYKSRRASEKVPLFRGRHVVSLFNSEAVSAIYRYEADIPQLHELHTLLDHGRDRFATSDYLRLVTDQNPKSFKKFVPEPFDVSPRIATDKFVAAYTQSETPCTLLLCLHGDADGYVPFGGHSDGVRHDVTQLAGKLTVKQLAEAAVARLKSHAELADAPLEKKDVYIIDACNSYDSLKQFWDAYQAEARKQGVSGVPFGRLIGVSERGQVGFSSLTDSTGSEFGASLKNLADSPGHIFTVGDVRNLAPKGQNPCIFEPPNRVPPTSEKPGILKQISKLFTFGRSQA